MAAAHSTFGGRRGRSRCVFSIFKTLAVASSHCQCLSFPSCLVALSCTAQSVSRPLPHPLVFSALPSDSHCHLLSDPLAIHIDLVLSHRHANLSVQFHRLALTRFPSSWPLCPGRLPCPLCCLGTGVTEAVLWVWMSSAVTAHLPSYCFSSPDFCLMCGWF